MKILKKFTSRKFWVAIAGMVAPILVLLNMPESNVTTVTALITSCGALIAYIFAETSVDIAREGGEENSGDE